MLIHFVQLSVMPASSKRVAKGKEQGYNLSELLPYAQKLITEGGPTGKDMVEEALDYYTKRAGTAPLLTTEEQSENKWDWSGEQIGVRDRMKNFMPEDVYTALDRDGKFKSMDDVLSERSPGVDDFVHFMHFFYNHKDAWDDHTSRSIYSRTGHVVYAGPMTQMILALKWCSTSSTLTST